MSPGAAAAELSRLAALIDPPKDLGEGEPVLPANPESPGRPFIF